MRQHEFIIVTLLLSTSIMPALGGLGPTNVKSSPLTMPLQDEPPITTFETIIVTSEMLSRTLDETGNSVVVINEKILDRRPDLKTVTDILQEIPNVTVVRGTGKAPTIRGVDGTGPAENAIAFFAGSRPRLNMEVDGRSLTYNEVVFGENSTWDVQQIEVLRGPQSSLSGRNAIAGTVNIKTNDPESERKTAVRIEAGNFEQKRLSLMHNQPISDTVAVRLTAEGFKRESPVSYDSYEGAKNPEEIKEHHLTTKLLFTPLDSKDTRILFTLANNKYTSPHTAIVTKPFNKQRSNVPKQAIHSVDTTSAIIDYSINLNDYYGLEIKAHTAKIDFDRKAAPNAGSATIESKEYAIEPRIHYYDDNGIEWVVGARYHDSDQDEAMDLFGGLKFDDDSQTMAVYGEGLIPIKDKFEVIAGIRFEKEKRERRGGDNVGAIMTIDLDDEYNAVLPKLGLNYHVNDTQMVGILLSRGYNAGGAGITATPPITSYEYDSEYVNSAELFGRQNWDDGRLHTFQNLFYSRYKDMQLPFDLTPNDSRDEAFTIRNAEEVNIYGLELGSTWQQNENLDLYANLALLKTEITKYGDGGLEGNSLFMAPKWSGKIGGNWHVDKWNAYLNGNFTEGYYSDINNRPDGKTSARTTIDAGFTYAISDTSNLYASVSNLFDNDQPITLYPGRNRAGQTDKSLDTAVLMEPRTFTLGLKTNF